MLRFRADHAAASDAVMSEWTASSCVASTSSNRLAQRPTRLFLQRPELGRALSDEARAELGKRIAKAPRLVVIYGDGLSPRHQPDCPSSTARSSRRSRRAASRTARVLRAHSRVKIMDEIARLTRAEAAVFVCGERPGLGFADSLSAYFILSARHGPHRRRPRVISNINPADARRPRRRATGRRPRARAGATRSRA